MVNGHTATGIAQAVFYAPVTLYAQYIGIRCWKYGSKAACYMIMTFTISSSTPKSSPREATLTISKSDLQVECCS